MCNRRHVACGTGCTSFINMNNDSCSFFRHTCRHGIFTLPTSFVSLIIPLFLFDNHFPSQTHSLFTLLFYSLIDIHVTSLLSSLFESSYSPHIVFVNISLVSHLSFTPTISLSLPPPQYTTFEYISIYFADSLFAYYHTLVSMHFSSCKAYSYFHKTGNYYLY